jgi:hypothetical protein
LNITTHTSGNVQLPGNSSGLTGIAVLSELASSSADKDSFHASLNSPFAKLALPTSPFDNLPDLPTILEENHSPSPKESKIITPVNTSLSHDREKAQHRRVHDTDEHENDILKTPSPRRLPPLANQAGKRLPLLLRESHGGLQVEGRLTSLCPTSKMHEGRACRGAPCSVLQNLPPFSPPSLPLNRVSLPSSPLPHAPDVALGSAPFVDP